MVSHEQSSSDAASLSTELRQPDVDFRGDTTGSWRSRRHDERHAALGHPRRRRVLAMLADRDEAKSLARLATDVLAAERDQPPEAISPEARRQCRVALHHVHLPKLAALGVLDYRPDGDPPVQVVDAAGIRALLDGTDTDSRTGRTTPSRRDGA